MLEIIINKREFSEELSNIDWNNIIIINDIIIIKYILIEPMNYFIINLRNFSMK